MGDGEALALVLVALELVLVELVLVVLVPIWQSRHLAVWDGR